MFKKQKNTLLFRPGAGPVTESAAAKETSSKKAKMSTAKPAAKKTALKKPAVKNLVVGSRDEGTAFSVTASVNRSSEPQLTRRASAPASAPKKVGVLDIDVFAGYLYRVLAEMSKRQNLFKFHPVEATVPVGLTLSGNRTRDIVRNVGGDAKAPDIADNVLATDVFKFAQPIVGTLGVDVLVCLVRPMIMDYLTMAEDGEDGIGWNYFSTYEGNVILASAHNLRDYAARSKRPYEACLALIILGQVLNNEYQKKLGFHNETRGCVLDYCENRDDILKVMTKPSICQGCLSKIPEPDRRAVQSMIDAIREYHR